LTFGATISLPAPLFSKHSFLRVRPVLLTFVGLAALKSKKVEKGIFSTEHVAKLIAVTDDAGARKVQFSSGIVLGCVWRIAMRRRLSASHLLASGDFVRFRLYSVHGFENKALTTLRFV